MNTGFRGLRNVVLGAVLVGCSLSVFAGGVGIDATRIIYPEQSKSVTTSVRNTDTRDSYLTQVAVSSTPDGGSAPFVATPPLFRMEPGGRNQIRITRTSQTGLPSDRESLFWFSMRAIPSSEEVKGSPTKLTGSMQVALGTFIKLIYRPVNLPVPPEKGFGMLTFTRAADGVRVHNASPYYVSFFSLKVGGRELITSNQKVKMVAPLSDVVVPGIKLSFPSKVTWTAINDIGGEVKFQGEVQ
ncbi:fimbrial biogenesis chaperone [Enterobacter ludwigii]